MIFVAISCRHPHFSTFSQPCSLPLYVRMGGLCNLVKNPQDEPKKNEAKFPRTHKYLLHKDEQQ